VYRRDTPKRRKKKTGMVTLQRWLLSHPKTKQKQTEIPVCLAAGGTVS